MRWRRLVTGKDSKTGIIIETRFLGPGRGLVLVDNLVVVVETMVSNWISNSTCLINLLVLI
jgi:hypothetical protein